MSVPRFLLIGLIIILSLAVGYLRDRKYKLITLIVLGLVLAFYLAQTEGGAG